MSWQRFRESVVEASGVRVETWKVSSDFTYHVVVKDRFAVRWHKVYAEELIRRMPAEIPEHEADVAQRAAFEPFAAMFSDYLWVTA